MRCIIFCLIIRLFSFWLLQTVFSNGVCVCTYLCISLGWTPRNGIVELKGVLPKLTLPISYRSVCECSFPHTLPTKDVTRFDASQVKKTICIILFTSDVGSFYLFSMHS